MSHFAKVVDGIVEEVIVVEQDWVNSLQGQWVQTSYNTYGGVHIDGGTPLRKNYAGIGMVYDSERDAFYVSQPYASWNLNDDSCIWEPPTAYPDDDKYYDWNEDTASWVVPASPYSSWILNETYNSYEPPTAYPDDGKIYSWDESTTSWVEVE